MAASTTVVNTTAGWTTPIQWTETGGGTVIEWYTKPVHANTLSGIAVGNIRALESNAAANATVRLEIAITDTTGSNVRIWGAANVNAELTTSETAYTVFVSGPDTPINVSDRVRFRLYIDDFEAAMGTGYTATMYYNSATANTSGDTYVTLPVALQEFTSNSFYVTYLYDNRTFTYINYTPQSDDSVINDVPGPYHYTTGAT